MKKSKKTKQIICFLAIIVILFLCYNSREFEHENKTYDNISIENTDNNDYGEVLGFKNEERLDEHYQKHGMDMGFESAAEYEKAAVSVVFNPDSLHKTEAEDGDDVFYLEKTNEIVFVSKKGYIRTFFRPDSGIDYYNRQ